MTKFKQLLFVIGCSIFLTNCLYAVTVSTPVFVQSSYNRYDKAEASFTIGAIYSNNYDPDIVAVDAEITKPQGTTVVFPCFYYIPCTFSPQSATYWEATENTANATWLLRFAPTEIGTYSIRIKVTENNATVSYSSSATFTVVASSNKGFIRLNASNPQFMNFDNGTPYYPVGTNIAWNDQRLSQYYTDFFSNVPRGGINWTRYWLADFSRQALEWSASHWSGWYSGLGRYSQKAAGVLDNVLDICKNKDCFMQLVLQHHGQFSTTVNPIWSSNPYNTAQGGTLSSASQFFSAATAKAQTKKQYRYIVARWGYSTNIMAWEFFNEVNYTDGTHADIDAWHAEMSAYIKGLDIHNHLITTSTHNANSLLQALDDNTNIDQLQFHYYGTNLETTVLSAAQTLDGLLTKPLLSGEFGHTNANYLNDNTGDHLRKTLWVNMMNRIPTTYWYWKEYIIPKNLYGVFTPLSSFMSSVDIVQETNAQGGILTFQNNPSDNGALTLTLNTQSPGFLAPNTPDPWTGVIDAAGNCTNINGLGRYLHGSTKGFNREVTFSANFTATGTAAITLRGSSSWGANILEIYLDGSLANTYTIANGTSGTYTLSNISAGTHSIKFRSAGQDWLDIASYAFTSASGNCLAYGYVGAQKAYGFVYDKSYGEWAATAPNTAGASLKFNVNVGSYSVEYWNPRTGETTDGGIVMTSNTGALVLNLPTFNKDIAFKISFASVLPAELLSFSGHTEGDKNRLEWQTVAESNVRNYTIQRSEDGNTAWNTIGTIAAKGNSTTQRGYFLYDNTPLSKAYYRLIINDLEGKSVNSKVIYIERELIEKAHLTLYPTLVQDNVTVEIQNLKSFSSFQIIDLTGRIWLTENMANIGSQHDYQNEHIERNFSVGQLPQGVYFFVVKTQNGTLTKKFVKT